MLMYSMGVSVDGYIADRAGGFDWGVPTDEQFQFHLDEVRGLSSYLLGRHLYEAMLPWETDPALRTDELRAAFADAWSALPKVVFSRTLDAVEGNARLAEASLADEIATAVGAGENASANDVSIGGAGLAAAAIELGLIDEFHVFRNPV